MVGVNYFGVASNIMEYITAFKDIFLGIAAITTSIVAVIGLKNWSRELRGKADFEIARALIRSVYKLRDEIRYARSPWTSGSEFPEGYSSLPRDRTAQNEAEAWSYVFTNRWKNVADAAQEFEAQVLEAEALWGAEIKSKANELRSCATSLRVSMEAFVDNKAKDGEGFKSDKEFAKSVQADIWAIKEDENQLSIKIIKAVSDIESAVRPNLKRD